MRGDVLEKGYGAPGWVLVAEGVEDEVVSCEESVSVLWGPVVHVGGAPFFEAGWLWYIGVVVVSFVFVCALLT